MPLALCSTTQQQLKHQCVIKIAFFLKQKCCIIPDSMKKINPAPDEIRRRMQNIRKFLARIMCSKWYTSTCANFQNFMSKHHIFHVFIHFFNRHLAETSVTAKSTRVSFELLNVTFTYVKDNLAIEMCQKVLIVKSYKFVFFKLNVKLIYCSFRSNSLFLKVSAILLKILVFYPQIFIMKWNPNYGFKHYKICTNFIVLLIKKNV